MPKLTGLGRDLCDWDTPSLRRHLYQHMAGSRAGSSHALLPAGKRETAARDDFTVLRIRQDLYELQRLRFDVQLLGEQRAQARVCALAHFDPRRQEANGAVRVQLQPPVGRERARRRAAVAAGERQTTPPSTMNCANCRRVRVR